jgi:hypothetical protein
MSLFVCDPIIDGSDIVYPGDRYGYLHVPADIYDNFPSFGEDVYRLGQNPVYEDHPDWPPDLEDVSCWLDSTCESHPEFGSGSFCYFWQGYFPGPYKCMKDDTKYYGNILISYGSITEDSLLEVEDDTYNQRGFSGGPVLDSMLHYLLATPASTVAGPVTDLMNRGFEGCSFKINECLGPYIGVQGYQLKHYIDVLGDVNDNNIYDLIETSPDIEYYQWEDKEVHMFDVSHDTWKRHTWQANPPYGTQDYPFYGLSLMYLTNNDFSYNTAFSHSLLSRMLGSKWIVTFQLYAQGSEELSICVRQNILGSSPVEDCNYLSNYDWQIATVELDLTGYSAAEAGDLEIGLGAIGDAVIQNMALLRMPAVKLEWDINDERELFKDDVHFDQPATYMLSSGETDPIRRILHPLIYGEAYTDRFASFASSLLGLKPETSYQFKFRYRTLWESGGQMYWQLRRTYNVTDILYEEVLPVRSIWRLKSYGLPTTGAREDVQLVIGGTGDYLGQIKHITISEL